MPPEQNSKSTHQTPRTVHGTYSTGPIAQHAHAIVDVKKVLKLLSRDIFEETLLSKKNMTEVCQRECRERPSFLE